MPFTATPAPDAPLALWASWYASQGWPLFPCHGKRPVTRHGLHDATTDLAAIQSWWRQWPDCNIGLALHGDLWALGSRSHFHHLHIPHSFT